jgi:cytochrome c oxidase cbb3-type subunit IV
MNFVEVRIVWTVVTFVVFVAIVVWAYSPRARSGFEAAARLPFEDDVSDGADRRIGGEGGR